LFYSPFGESLYSQHAQTGEYNTPHRFNAKELDVETGNYYYGARYYNPRVSVWLSVDPMSAAAPGWTPYRFCFNNPVNIVDPTGMLEDDYKLDKKTGEISLIRETDDDFDVLYATDDEGNVDDNKSVKVNDRSVLPSLSKKDAANYTTRTLWGDKVGSWAKTNSSSDAYGVFKFASDNSDVEWGLQQYSGNRFILGTSHFSESVGGLNGVSGYDILDLQIDYHSHPGSGSPVDDVASGMIGDQGYASGIVRTFLKNGVDYKNHPQFRIYRPHVAKPYRFNYSPWKTKFNSIAVGSYFDLR
jgi:RHS repeat-associated protein